MENKMNRDGILDSDALISVGQSVDLAGSCVNPVTVLNISGIDAEIGTLQRADGSWQSEWVSIFDLKRLSNTEQEKGD